MEYINNVINVDRQTMLPMFYDILRLMSIQITTQFLVSLSTPGMSFFTETFMKTTLFLCIGVMLFWMIIYKFMSSNLTSVKEIVSDNKILENVLKNNEQGNNNTPL